MDDAWDTPPKKIILFCICYKWELGSIKHENLQREKCSNGAS